MSFLRFGTLSGLLLMTSQAAATADRDAAGVGEFLRRLYAPYVAGDTRFDPTDAAAPAIFDTRLLALIRRDQASAAGEVGALDGDPICDCQDFERLTSLSITVKARGARRATATVRFSNFGKPVVLDYTLRRTAAGWRVTDIASAGMPSLAGLLNGQSPGK